jgi:hypothetical protein
MDIPFTWHDWDRVLPLNRFFFSEILPLQMLALKTCNQKDIELSLKYIHYLFAFFFFFFFFCGTRV